MQRCRPQDGPAAAGFPIEDITTIMIMAATLAPLRAEELMKAIVFGVGEEIRCGSTDMRKLSTRGALVLMADYSFIAPGCNL